MLVKHQKAWYFKITKSNKHPQKAHDFWMERNGVCPYCRMGSKPVEDMGEEI